MNNSELGVLEWGQGSGKFFLFIPLFSSLLSCLLCCLSFHAGLPLPLFSSSFSSHFLYFSLFLLSHSFSLSRFFLYHFLLIISPPPWSLFLSLCVLAAYVSLLWAYRRLLFHTLKGPVRCGTFDWARGILGNRTHLLTLGEMQHCTGSRCGVTVSPTLFSPHVNTHTHLSKNLHITAVQKMSRNCI